MKQGQTLMSGEWLRRQVGTINYADTDRTGKKVDRNIECFIPAVPQEAGSQQIWAWPDTDRKKNHVYKEF